MSKSNRWPREEIDGELPEYEKEVVWKVTAVPVLQAPGAYPNNEEKLYTVRARGQEEKRVPESQMLPVKFLKGDVVVIGAGGGAGGTWIHKVTAVRMMRTVCSEKGWEVVVEYGLEHVREDGIIRPDTQRASMLGMKEKGDAWRIAEGADSRNDLL